MPYVNLADTYRLVLNAVIAGEEISNVFHFGRSAPAGSAAGLTTSFISTVLPIIQDVVSAAVLFTTVDATNLDDPDDTASSLANVAGLRGTDIVSTFNAWGFRLYPSVGSIQTGGKRFAGVTENEISNGVAVGTQLTRLAVLATRLQTPFFQGLITYTPAIYSRIIVATIPIIRVATIAAAAYNWQTTQNSRKVE